MEAYSRVPRLPAVAFEVLVMGIDVVCGFTHGSSSVFEASSAHVVDKEITVGCCVEKDGFDLHAFVFESDESFAAPAVDRCRPFVGATTAPRLEPDSDALHFSRHA